VTHHRGAPSRILRSATPLVCALAALAGCSGDDDAASTTTAPEQPEVVETTAPPGRPPGAVDTGLRDLRTGQCFDTIDEPTVESVAVWVVDCETPHGYEVYDVVTYEGEGAGRGTDYPGVAVVQDWSEQACFDRFEAFVGVRWTLSELDIAVWWPSEESWARADRTIICTVMSDTGEDLTGTQRGTER
jgi:hypothetical protein